MSHKSYEQIAESMYRAYCKQAERVDEEGLAGHAYAWADLDKDTQGCWVAAAKQAAAPEGWRWMTHPTRNDGRPLPVQVFTQDGVDYYRPFDFWATEFEWGERGDEWVDVTHTTPPAAQPAVPNKELGHFVQPHWGHVGQAFIDGAREARVNPSATDDDVNRAADGYTKRLFEELDPESEQLLRANAYPQSNRPVKG